MWAVSGMEWASTGEDGEWKNALTCRSEVWVYRKGRWEQSEDDGKISSTYGNFNPFWVILNKFPIISFKMLISILNKCCIQSYFCSFFQKTWSLLYHKTHWSWILMVGLEQKYIGNTQDIENLCLIGGISGGQVVKEVRKVRNSPLSAPSFKTKAVIFQMQLWSCGVACAHVWVPTCVHVSPPAPCTRKPEAGEFVISQHAVQHFIFARERKK